MTSRKHLLIAILSILLLTISVTAVFATIYAPEYQEGTFRCNQVTFSFITYTFVNFRVIDESNRVVSNEATSTNAGLQSLTLELDPAQDSGTVLQIQHDYGGWQDIGPAVACAGTGNRRLPPPPPWQHFGSEDAYGAFRFFEETPGNPVMVFLRVENNGHGNIAFYTSQKLLEQDFPCDGTTQTLYSSPDGIYNLFLRPDCHIQANVGPDFEGKMHIISFETIPPGDTTEYWTIDAEGHIAQRVIDPTIF